MIRTRHVVMCVLRRPCGHFGSRSPLLCYFGTPAILATMAMWASAADVDTSLFILVGSLSRTPGDEANTWLILLSWLDCSAATWEFWVCDQRRLTKVRLGLVRAGGGQVLCSLSGNWLKKHDLSIQGVER